MDGILEILQTLNSLSPLAIIALLGTVIFMLVKGKTSADSQLRTVQENHLHELPDIAVTLRNVNETLQRLEVKLAEDLTYIKSKLNGSGRN